MRADERLEAEPGEGLARAAMASRPEASKADRESGGSMAKENLAKGNAGKGNAGKREMSKSDKRLRPPGSKSVGWALVQAARLHRSRVGDRLAALDLFAGQEQVVQALAAAGTMTMGDLAATLRVRPPTASKTISRLAALGFVERRAEAGDGRIVRVRLTEMGLAKATAIERIWDEVEAELLDGFDGKEKRRLRKLLRKAARNLAEVSGVTGHEVEGDAEMDEDEPDTLALPDVL